MSSQACLSNRVGPNTEKMVQNIIKCTYHFINTPIQTFAIPFTFPLTLYAPGRIQGLCNFRIDAFQCMKKLIKSVDPRNKLVGNPLCIVLPVFFKSSMQKFIFGSHPNSSTAEGERTLEEPQT